MTSNPNSLARDDKNRRLVCEVCFEWTDFDDLFYDDWGEMWDTCKWCWLDKPRPSL